jgi:hypothetical protein
VNSKEALDWNPKSEKIGENWKTSLRIWEKINFRKHVTTATGYG